MTNDIPEGFKPLPISSGFIGVNGPLYMRRVSRPDGDIAQAGFRVEERHTNPMGNCHGGMLATFAEYTFTQPFFLRRPFGAGCGKTCAPVKVVALIMQRN